MSKKMATDAAINNNHDVNSSMDKDVQVFPSFVSYKNVSQVPPKEKFKQNSE